MSSGLYERLLQEKLIVGHEEVDDQHSPEAYKILRPNRIPFISYPYEWCHAQVQAAAKLTLRILRISLEYGMILKDASPYNIQFIGSKPIFIDTLSWEIRSDRSPWIAYRQFCAFFLVPLALSHFRKLPVNRTLRAWPEGMPLNIATQLLPGRTKWNLHLFLHIHLNARITQNATKRNDLKSAQASVNLERIIDSLEKAINRLTAKKPTSGWSSYYQDMDSRGDYFSNKDRIVQQWIKDIGPSTMALDTGCNRGHFSERLRQVTDVIAIDADPELIDLNYRTSLSNPAEHPHHNILYLTMDICDLSCDQGWGGKERTGFSSRMQYDVVLSLAVMHHLIIGRQVPLDAVIKLLDELCNKWLIIEYIPEDDPWSIALRSQKPGLVHSYTHADFEQAIKPYFSLMEKSPLPPTGRWLYKLRK